MTERIERAKEISSEGFNCSQAVVGVFCKKYGIDEKTAMKFAGGFGGGMRCGEACGAVTGAIMVIGLKYGQTTPNDKEAKDKCGEYTTKFMEEYKKRNQFILCRDMLGYDPRDTVEVEKHADEKPGICSNAIETAIKILEDMGF